MADRNYQTFKESVGAETCKNFLKYLDNYPNKTQYAKITVLTWDEATIRSGEITGRVTGGTINLSGTSNVRRNGSLSLCIAENDQFYKLDEINNLLSLNKKVKVQIGFRIDFKYQGINSNDLEPGDILWFPLGIFVIKDPSVNRSASGLTISLSLSDKMALLNGEAGGNLPAAVVFSETDVQSADGTWYKEYNKIYDIIYTIVNQYGSIPASQIKINRTDVPEKTKQVMKWTDDAPLYKYTEGDVTYIDISYPKNITPETYKTGANIGFIETDFIWPGEALTANTGETITSVLDKIKTLGDYEYFFDINGDFIWQKKQVYKYADSSSVEEIGFYTGEGVRQAFLPQLKDSENNVNIAYDFTNSPLIISYSNSPQYKNIKNDYIIWGKRKTSSGAEMPIRYHVLLDKPDSYKYDEGIDNYKNIYAYKYLVAEPNIYGLKLVKLGGSISDTTQPEPNIAYTKGGKHYVYDFNLKKYVRITLLGELTLSEEDNWRTVLYCRGRLAAIDESFQEYADNPLYKDLEVEWPKLFNLETSKWRSENGIYPDSDTIDYYCHVIDGGDNLNYCEVGRQLTKVVNDTNINCVYSPDIPSNIILKNEEDVPDDYRNDSEYTVLRVSDAVYGELYTGGSQNSAFEQARSYVTQGTNYANSISLSAIPIYYLEPNTLIKVKDTESNINDIYVINSISLPLAYNGTMTISASLALIEGVAASSNT